MLLVWIQLMWWHSRQRTAVSANGGWTEIASAAGTETSAAGTKVNFTRRFIATCGCRICFPVVYNPFTDQTYTHHNTPHTHTHTRTHARTHARTHTTYTCAHTRTHTHTNARARAREVYGTDDTACDVQPTPSCISGTRRPGSTWYRLACSTRRGRRLGSVRPLLLYSPPPFISAAGMKMSTLLTSLVARGNNNNTDSHFDIFCLLVARGNSNSTDSHFDIFCLPVARGNNNSTDSHFDIFCLLVARRNNNNTDRHVGIFCLLVARGNNNNTDRHVDFSCP